MKRPVTFDLTDNNLVRDIEKWLDRIYLEPTQDRRQHIERVLAALAALNRRDDARD